MKKTLLIGICSAILSFNLLFAQTIASGDFENATGNTVPNWTLISTKASITSSAHGGSKALHIAVAVNDTSDGLILAYTGMGTTSNNEALHFVTATYNPTPDTIYGWIKGNSAIGDRVKINVGFKNGSTEFANGLYNDVFSSTVYKQFKAAIVNPLKYTATSMKVEISLESANGSGFQQTGTFIDIDDLGFGVATNVLSKDAVVGSKIEKIYPSPATENVNIVYNLSANASVKMEIYDITGRIVKIPVNEYQTEGKYKAIVEGLQSGIYICSLTVNGQSQQQKLVVADR